MHDAPEEGGEWIEKKGRQGTRRWQCRTCKSNKKPPNREGYTREFQSVADLEVQAVAIDANIRLGPKDRRT